jgi:hypothetical protein
LDPSVSRPNKITDNSIATDALSEILKKFQQVQTTANTSLEQRCKTIEHQEITLLEEIGKTKTRLETLTNSFKTRADENTTKKQTSEMKDEAAPDKEQEFIDEEGQKRNATNNYNSQGEVAGDITQNDQENQDTLINSNSEEEGEYQDEEETNKTHSKSLRSLSQTEQIRSLKRLKTQSVLNKKPQDCVFLNVLIQRPIHENQRKAREIPKMIPLVVQMKNNVGGTNRLKLLMMKTATRH